MRTQCSRISVGLVLAAVFVFSIPAMAAEPSITLSPTTGAAGTSVAVTGSGFPPGEVVALYVDSPQPYLEMPGPIADTQGSFRQEIKWPAKNYDETHRINPDKPGIHNICGDTGYPGSSQAVAAKACAKFTVAAPATPTAGGSPQGVPYGQELFAIAILAILGIGATLWMRHTK